MSKTETDEATTAGAAADEHELGEAGAQLSTAPQERAVPGSFGGVMKPGAAGRIAWAWRETSGWVRWFWRQLTSMRVALILLFLLSLGAIPGSLIPQTGVDETKVAEFRAAHETLAPIYDDLGLFDVYSSVWFSAIYILLFVSLIGCIVPRTWQFVGQLRSRPPGAPGRLTRLPAYTTWRTDSDPEEVRELALALLKHRRFRAHSPKLSASLEQGGAPSYAVAAEKGYLREAGNLIFHIALIVMLVSFAAGQLFKSEGGKLIVQGGGFANTLTQYDDFKSGSLFDKDHDLAPFSFTLDKFVGTYEREGSQRGTPRVYEAHVTYAEGADGAEKKARIEVNDPLEVDGSKVHLIGHGYAPVVTVRDGSGKTVYSGAVPLLPMDSNVTSSGAIKVMDGYRNKAGEKEQLGFQAFFVPTFAGAGKGTMLSQYPGLDFPVLALNAYHGSLGVDAGLPQNVYQLDKRKMKAFKDGQGADLKQRMLPGETMKLPGGAGSITFEKGVKEWATFSISQQPGNVPALAGAIAAIAGLAGSLFIQRRRIWVRAVRGQDGVTIVEMAGLGRTESSKLPEELADLAATLHAQAPTAPDPHEPADPAEPAEPVEGARA
ncbi:cytochrome c biogenesis protein ResB [Streptomyces hypolithicus]